MYIIHSRKLTVCTWNLMIGIQLAFWKFIFSRCYVSFKEGIHFHYHGKNSVRTSSRISSHTKSQYKRDTFTLRLISEKTPPLWHKAWVLAFFLSGISSLRSIKLYLYHLESRWRSPSPPNWRVAIAQSFSDPEVVTFHRCVHQRGSEVPFRWSDGFHRWVGRFSRGKCGGFGGWNQVFLLWIL